MTFRDFKKEFEPLELEIEDEEELDRLEHIAACVAFFRGLGLCKSDISQSESPWERSAEEEEGSQYVQDIVLLPSLSCANVLVDTKKK
jgi:hypothetical protein